MIAQMKQAMKYEDWCNGKPLYDAREGGKLNGIKHGDYVLTEDGLQVNRNGHLWHLMSMADVVRDSRFFGVVVGVSQMQVEDTQESLIAQTRGM